MPSMKVTERDIRKLCESLWVRPVPIYRNPQGFFIRKTRGSASFRCDATANAAIAAGLAAVAADGTLQLTDEGREAHPCPW